MGVFRLVRSDVKRFGEEHGKGVLPMLYYPMFSALIIYRMSCALHRYKILRPISYFLVRLNDLLHGVWIGPNVIAGPGLFLGHSRGLIVNPNTVIGKNVSIMQRVTLGGSGVVIGDNVQINAGATVIASKARAGGIFVGDNSIIGACAVVTRDVPPNVVVAGNPAKVIRVIDQ